MKKTLRKIVDPLRILINDSRFTGVMLIVCTVISLILANSSFCAGYKNIWEHQSFAPAYRLPDTLLSWINNFMMAFFFLLAGMEIKRELVSGELSSVKKAALPFGAALGGMLVPAVIFIAFNLHTPYSKGWGIPMATDIAFSLGIASILGKRVPVGLKILLMAVAIIDDLGAIVVIALFYGGHTNWIWLAIAALFYSILIECNYFKLKFGAFQIILSLAVWFTLFNSGIEASIAGVLVAFAMPVGMLPKMEKQLHGYVNFLILPLFALANTAIALPANLAGSLNSRLSLGIMFGLVIGKPVGIFLFSRLLAALNIASLPGSINWPQVFGMGILAGIGFTMSIFITVLGFADETSRNAAKVAVLIGVALSFVFSILYFMMLNNKKGFADGSSIGETDK